MTLEDCLQKDTFKIVRSTHAGAQLDAVLEFLRTSHPELYEQAMKADVTGKQDVLAQLLEFAGSVEFAEGASVDELLEDAWGSGDAEGTVLEREDSPDESP